jgi:hypothetical protein
MADDVLTATSLHNNIRERIAEYRSESDPDILLSETNTPLKKELGSDYLFSTDAYKAVSTNEFTNGTLMCDAILDQFRTFAIEMMRQLQQEYNCQTASEKATCELATMEFERTLEIRWQMKESLVYQRALAYSHTCGQQSSIIETKGICAACNRSRTEIQLYAQLGKELDRANRHYLTAIQTLRMMKQAPMQVTINTRTAVVGQNQIVQTNSKHE